MRISTNYKAIIWRFHKKKLFLLNKITNGKNKHQRTVKVRNKQFSTYCHEHNPR